MIIRLIVSIALGIGVGLVLSGMGWESGIGLVLALRGIAGQLLFYLVPLIILGFVTPSIALLRRRVSRLLAEAFGMAYGSSVVASLFGIGVSYVLVPLIGIGGEVEAVRGLPEALFRVEIAPLMSVMTALVTSVVIGLGVVWANAERVGEALVSFQGVVVAIVRRVLLPLLPIYVATTFSVLAYEGTLSRLVVFLPAIVIALLCHYVWIALLYAVASLRTGRNCWEIVRHYGAAYVTALGTMSSAATLGVALECARRSKTLRRETVDFAVPLFSNIHLCGSVLTETIFVCVVSQTLYGVLPSVGTLVAFALLLGVFAVGAPGVPGGTVLASLGIVVSVLGFDANGTALLIAIFALQDSFGTACNVVSDGALVAMLSQEQEGEQERNI